MDEMTRRLIEMYGARADGTPKGQGFYGPLQRPDGGVSSEISIGVGMDGREQEIPTLVPGLDQSEIDFLLNFSGDPGEIPESIIVKAINSARKRAAEGLSPFVEALPPARNVDIGAAQR